VRTAVELHEFAEVSRTQPALAMNGGTALPRRAEAVLAQQPAKSLPTEREALAFHKLLAEMVIVEAGIGAACQPQDALAYGSGQAAVARPPAIGVCQRRLSVFAHAFVQALNLAHAQRKESGGPGTRQLPLHAPGDNGHSL